MTTFRTGPEAPFIQRAAVPGRDGRRRVAFGYIRGPLAGVRAVPAVADELLGLLAEGYRRRLADDALLADLAEALREQGGKPCT